MALEGVERESQQCRWEDELLHIKDQGHQSSNAQTTGFELAAADGQQQKNREGGNALKQREQSALCSETGSENVGPV